MGFNLEGGQHVQEQRHGVILLILSGGQVWAGSQSLKHTAATTTRWSLVAENLRFYDDAFAIILALGYFLRLEEQKSQLECFASAASACGVRGLWKMGQQKLCKTVVGPLIQEELCPTSLPW